MVGGATSLHTGSATTHETLKLTCFQSLHLLCDNEHDHAKWAPYKDEHGKIVYPTAEEAAYPELLCERIACILKAEAMQAGYIFPEDLQEQLETEPNAAKRQIFTTQPRGRKLRPLVSEFQQYQSVLFPLNSQSVIDEFMNNLPKVHGFAIVH